MNVFNGSLTTRVLGIVLVLIVLVGSGPFVRGEEAPAAAPGPKYVFLFIGDGMGEAHVAVTEAYLHATRNLSEEGPTPGFGKLVMSGFPVFGMMTTYSANHQTTDSAAAGTAIATGHKTKNKTIGLAPDGETPYQSIATLAKAKGMKVGIVSSTSLNDATPAAFYGHRPSRSDLHELAHQMVQIGRAHV